MARKCSNTKPKNLKCWGYVTNICSDIIIFYGNIIDIEKPNGDIDNINIFFTGRSSPKDSEKDIIDWSEKNGFKLVWWKRPRRK